MAKKKKHKKHNFNQSKSKASSSAAMTSTAVAEAPSKLAKEVNEAQAARPAKPLVDAEAMLTPAEEQHLQQIKSDVRRVIILAASFVALQVVLWFLFEHTGVGPAVYGLIHH